MSQRCAHMDPGEGELWLSAKKDQDPWPVVICDEEMLQILAKGKRPANARQKNGNWRKEFGSSGDLADQRCFPTMRLGTMQLCWTPRKRLVPIDIQQAHNIKIRTEDRQLANACNEVIERYGQKDLQYWKGRLLARQPSVSDIRTHLHIQREETALSKKRKVGQSGFNFRPNSLLDSLNALEDGDTAWDDDQSTYRAKSIKIEHENQEAPVELLTLGKETPGSDRTKQSASAMQMERLSTPVSSSSSRTLLGDPLPGKPTSETILANPMYSSSSLDIYVGSPHKVFMVLDKGLVWFSDHFEENLSATADSKLYVMSPLLLSINPDDFEPLAAYLRDEIYPDVAGRVVWEDRQRETEAKMLMDLKPCAMTYHIANKLGFGDFTFAVKGKLKSMTVAPTKEFIHTVRYLLRNGAMVDAIVVGKVISCLAEHFWELMKIDGGMLSELMASSPNLCERVLKKLLQAAKEKHSRGRAGENVAPESETTDTDHTQ